MSQYQDMKAYLVADCDKEDALAQYEKSAKTLGESMFGLDFRDDQMKVIAIRPNTSPASAAERVKTIAMEMATPNSDEKIRQVFFGFSGGAKCIVRAFTELRREMDADKFKHLKANTALVTLGATEYVDPSMAKVVMNVVPPSARVTAREDFFVLPEAESKPPAPAQAQKSTSSKAAELFQWSSQSVQSSAELLQMSVGIADAFGLPLSKYMNVTRWKAVLDMLIKGMPRVQGPLNRMIEQ